MALQTSGSISLNDVNVELGNSGTSQIDMNSSAVRNLFGVASGEIGMDDGYGASNTLYKFTQTSNGRNSGMNINSNVLTSLNRSYTFECWARPLGTSGEIWLLSQYIVVAGRTAHGMRNQKMATFCGSDGGWYDSPTSMGTSLSHYAYVSNGNGSVSLWKNGVYSGNTGTGHNNNTNAPNTNTIIGSGSLPGAVGTGCEYRSWRINSNLLYTGTGSFTPPSVDGGLTNISGTVALWNGSSNTATDASGNHSFSANNITFAPV